MNERLLALWAKVVANKQTLIKAGSAVAGAALGLAVAAVIASHQSEDGLALEDDELDEDFETE